MPDSADTPWRRLATAAYAPPVDGRISGSLDVDVTEALRFLAARRAAGVHLTMTHLLTAAVGRALHQDAPEINAFVRRGRVVRRRSVDVGLTVSIQGGSGVALVRVRDAHSRSLEEIAESVRESAARHRAGDESALNRNKDILGRVPWPFRRWLLRGLVFAVNELGLRIPGAGLSNDAFGSVLITNVGTFGLATANLALLPLARLPAAIAMGRVEEKPVVRDGQIVIRSLLPLTGTFDHRIVDGAQAGKLATGVATRLEKPELLS